MVRAGPGSGGRRAYYRPRPPLIGRFFLYVSARAGTSSCAFVLRLLGAINLSLSFVLVTSSVRAAPDLLAPVCSPSGLVLRRTFFEALPSAHLLGLYLVLRLVTSIPFDFYVSQFLPSDSRLSVTVGRCWRRGSRR